MTERERKAFNRGIQVAIGMITFRRDEAFRMANDTILLDPIFNDRATRETLVKDIETSQKLAEEGHACAMIAHQCQHMIDELKALKLKPKGEEHGKARTD